MKIINMIKELNETTSKEIKESMRTMFYQREYQQRDRNYKRKPSRNF